MMGIMNGNKLSWLLSVLIARSLLVLPLQTVECFNLALLRAYPQPSDCVLINPYDRGILLRAKEDKAIDNENDVDDAEDDEDEWISAEISEVIVNDEVDDVEEEEWIPDREKARQRHERVAAYQSQPPSGVSKTQAKLGAGMNKNIPREFRHIRKKRSKL